MAVTATVRTTDTFDAGPLNTAKWIQRAPASGTGGGVVFDTAGFVNLKSSDYGSYSGYGATWLSENITPATSNADVEVRTRFLVGVQDGTFRLYARSASTNDGNRYELAFNPGNGNLALSKIIPFGSSVEYAAPDFRQAQGAYINAVLAVWQENGVTNLGAKWWVDGTAEPADWLATATDTSTPLTSGYHGAVGYPGGAKVPRNWQVDYLTVSAVTVGSDRTLAVTDSTGLSDSFGGNRLTGIEDAVGLADEFSRTALFYRDFNETPGPAEEFEAAVTYDRVFTDGAGLDDVADPSAVRPVLVDETVGLGDERDGWGYLPVTSDAASPVEGPITLHANWDPELVGPAESVEAAAVYARDFDDTAAIAEDAYLAREIPVDEFVPVVETVASATSYIRSFDDQAGLADQADLPGVDYVRSFDDGIGPADTFSASTDGVTYWTAEVDDGVHVADVGLERSSAWRVIVRDEAGVVDVFSGVGDQERRFDDWATITDEVFFRRDWALELTDRPLRGDQADYRIVAPAEWRRTVVDIATPKESLGFTGRKPRGRGTALLARQQQPTSTLGAQRVAVAALVD